MLPELFQGVCKTWESQVILCFFHSRPVSGVGWGVLKLPVCPRSVAGFTYTQPPPSPSPHKQNRGERFFRGGGCTQAFFFTITALKIRYTYLNDDHYSSIGFRMGLILLSETKIVILIVELRD